MSLREQTPQNSLPTPAAHPATGRTQRWRWGVLAVVIIGLVAGGWWAWPRFIRADEPLPQSSSSTSVVNTTSSSGNAAAQQTQPVAQTQSTTVKVPVQAPAQQPTSTPVATATLVTTQATSGMVVIAGTNGATLLTTPGGEQIQSVAIGALLNATGRSAERTWLYVSSVDGVAGWVAVDQIVAFGIEKLPVVTLAAPGPALAVANEQATAPESVTITATTGMSVAAAVAPTAVVAASGSETVAPAATAQPDAMGVQATVIVSGARLNIRSGPGTNYGIIGKAGRNEEVTVLARNATADWVQVALPAGADGFGWVVASYLRLERAIADLPVSTEVSTAPSLAATTTASTTTSTNPSPSAPQPVATPAAAVASAGPASGLSGTLVFQSSPGGMIYAYNLNSGRLWQLTNGFDPAISPNGQTVAFVRTAGENGIYLINLDGSNERLIFSGRSTLAAPKWSPDGSYIVFARGDEYQECRDLGRGGCLTDEELLDQNPNFPVDDFPLVKNYESNLARVDANGGNYRDIANLESARAADWNEAGIVYQSKAGLQITADEPDVTSQLVIHDPFKPAFEDPDWQPNGGKIVFVSRGGNHREIFAVNPDGSGMVALTRPVTTLVDELPNNVAPAWSPNGQYIVFLSNRGDDNSAGDWKLWVMNADGSNQHPLPIDVAINYTYGNEQLVSWGP